MTTATHTPSDPYMQPMGRPAGHMYHVPCKDSEQRAFFLRCLERDFRGCEEAAGGGAV